MTQKKLEKYPKKSSSTLFHKDHNNLISRSEALIEADKKRKEMLNKWSEQNKKEKFDYIFNEIVGKIKTFQLTDEIKSELETLCREIYNTGYSRGVKEGILD
jgi:hypothetical protein